MSATPCEPPSEEEPASMDETPSENEPPSTEETPCASGVVTDVPACVLPGTPCAKGAPQPETARVCEARCAGETPRVSAPASVVCVSEARVSERPCVVASCDSVVDLRPSMQHYF